MFSSNVDYKQLDIYQGMVTFFKAAQRKKEVSFWEDNHAETFMNYIDTPRQKSIRALEIVLAIFLCFECQFLSFYACYKEYKA